MQYLEKFQSAASQNNIHKPIIEPSKSQPVIYQNKKVSIEKTP